MNPEGMYFRYGRLTVSSLTYHMVQSGTNKRLVKCTGSAAKTICTGIRIKSGVCDWRASKHKRESKTTGHLIFGTSQDIRYY